uniref:LysR substrate-binding domain-containing protein n=1 Tax=Amycolatopsis pittospori TaxID=2749434 RepID=UPI0015F0A7F0
VGVIPTVAAVDVPAALQTFHRRYPHVRIGLRVGGSGDLVEQVRDSAIEVAILGLPVSDRPEGVGTRELARDDLVAVVAPGHPLADESEVDLSRLSSEVFVDFPAGTAGRAQTDQAFAAAKMTREVAFEVTAADFMARLIHQGLGVALLPSNYVPNLSGVVSVPVTDAPTRIEHLVWNRFTVTPAAKAFLEVLGVASGDSGSLDG